MKSSSPLGLSIVIPIFNESENVPKLFEKLKEFSLIASFPFHFILVDGCSSDGTPNLIDHEIAAFQLENVELVRMDTRKGYGFDIMQGIKKAEFDTIGWSHADLQTDLNDLAKGYGLIQANAAPCIIKGKRINRGLLEKFFTFGMLVLGLNRICIRLR